MEIKKLGDVQPYTKVLVYGVPGVGKTVLASTAPKPLYIDCEAGTMSIKIKNIDVVHVTKWSDMGEVFRYLNTEKHNYESVVLDSLTEMQKLSMDAILAQGVESKPNKNADVAELRDWQCSIEQIRKMVRAFRSLPMHTVFTALRGETKDDSTGEIFYKPSLPGKLADDVAAYMDIVGYYFVQDMQTENDSTVSMRRLLVQPKGQYIAKDRSGKLGPVVNEPTIPILLSLIYGKEGGSK